MLINCGVCRTETMRLLDRGEHASLYHCPTCDSSEVLENEPHPTVMKRAVSV